MAKSSPNMNPNALMVGLRDALGLEKYRIAAIDIKARAGCFARATVEFFIPEECEAAVAKAVADHRSDLNVAPVVGCKGQDHPYGHCPVCGAPGAMRERRFGGDYWCEQGHVYPAAKSLPCRTIG